MIQIPKNEKQRKAQQEHRKLCESCGIKYIEYRESLDIPLGR